MTTDTHPQSSSLSYLRHELRTPINAIIGFSEMLLEEIEEETEKEAEGIPQLQQIRDCGIQLLSVVNTVLNPIQLEDSQFDLEELISNSILKVRLQESTVTAIDYCQQLLVLNSAQSMPELQEDIKKIEKSARSLLNMTENLLEIIRDPTLDCNSSAPLTDNEVMRQLEQQIIVTENTDVNFNLKAIAKSNSSEVSTILLVDDNQSNLDLLSWQIEGEGHKVITADNGRDALHKIQNGDFDLILLDIIMPEVNGYQLLTILRNSAYSQWQHIPVIMISALDEIDSVVKCIELGAEDYLPKPFNPILLKARINACLDKKRMRDREVSVLSQLTQAHQEITNLNQRLKAENNRLSAEVEVTQRIQTMILPKEQELNQISSLEIAGFMESADEVGGDYYDVLQGRDRLKIGIGDVTGHGLESGVLMLMVQTAVRTLIESNETDPQRFLAILNRTIYKNIQRMNCDKNLTLCLVDYQDGKLTLSGQHEEILVVRANGEMMRIDTIDLGFPVGLEEDITDFISQAEIQLNKDDVVVLYTDGITEAENNLGEHYGLDKLCQIVQQNYQKSAREIREIAIGDVRHHIKDHKIYDDITLVIIKQQ